MASSTSSGTCRSAGRSSLVAGLALLLLWGCDKESEHAFSDVPAIELVSLSHDTIRQYEDVLVITIAYKDGDGDLGFPNPEEYALFVRDIRLATFDAFYVGPLAPPDANVPIKGQLNIEFPSLFLFGNGAVEQTRFEIKMIDRAGNESNLLETKLIAITRD